MTLFTITLIARDAFAPGFLFLDLFDNYRILRSGFFLEEEHAMRDPYEECPEGFGFGDIIVQEFESQTAHMIGTVVAGYGFTPRQKSAILFCLTVMFLTGEFICHAKADITNISTGKTGIWIRLPVDLDRIAVDYYALQFKERLSKLGLVVNPMMHRIPPGPRQNH